LDSREDPIAAWEDGLVASKITLGKACMEHDIEHILGKAARQDYLARTCAFTSSSRSSIKFSRMLDEHQILLSLQLMDLEVREVKLVDKQVHNVHSFDRRDLSVELEELCASVDGVEDEHITKVGKLSTLVVGISNALVDLGMLHILEQLREEHASDAGP
jgi:hypothetical protein